MDLTPSTAASLHTDARSSFPKDGEPLQLELSLAEGYPWPSLVVRAAVRFISALIRLRKLQPCEGGFILHDVFLKADPADALIVRTLLGLPTVDGVAYRAEGDQFGPVLSLLRKVSPNSLLRQSERLEAIRVLDLPPHPRVTFQALNGSELRVRAVSEFVAGPGGESLGMPVTRGAHWWTFATAVTPAPAALEDRLLRSVFESGAQEFTGESALTVVRAAADRDSGVQSRVGESLSAALAARPLRPALHVEGSAEGPVRVRLEFAPEGGASTRYSPEEVWTAVREGKSLLRRGAAWHRIDAPALRQAQHELRDQAGLEGDWNAGMEAREEQIPEVLAWARNREADHRSPWNVYVSEAVAGAHQVSEEAAEVRLRMGLEEGGAEAWFTLNLDWICEGRTLSPEEVERLLRLRKRWLRDGKRWIRLNTEGVARVRRMAEQHGLRPRGPGAYQVPARERERIEQLFSLAHTVEHTRRYKEFLERLEGFETLEPFPAPESLRLPLREYQVRGYRWLRFLAKFGLNGILADDMGLGKTAQSLALLTALKEEQGSRPSLVVCPTSLLDNWSAEALRFSPLLKVLRYRGSPQQRDQLRRQIGEQDLVLATYATVRNDVRLLQDEPWRCVILDEAHAIKNASAAVSKALKTIRAQHRLALTGTPVQNRLDELWSLFDFLMPGFLGSRGEFFRAYETPVNSGQPSQATPAERAAAQAAAESLRARIRPFVLRRLKTEVARELPAKIEQVVSCELTPEQVGLYQPFVTSEQAQTAVRELETHGPGRAQGQILAALSMLRKICNHPDLVYLAGEVTAGRTIVPLPGYEERSSKLQALADLMDQCRSGGHRALIFSQSTAMLDILEHFLAARGDTSLRLDGSTPADQRQPLVDRFNAQSGPAAFLISTRAGGSGLNLTAADTVIFYDHDWNPANDRQAEDRAHRIGQERVVNVYRLVTQGTVEEKILQRQALKQELADSVLVSDPTGLSQLTKDELLSLFSLSAT